MNKIVVLFTIALLGLFSCTTDSIDDQVLSESTSNDEKSLQVISKFIPKVYATGDSKGNIATVWIDGVTTELTDGTQTARGNSITLDSNDNVYVAGIERNGSRNVAKLWINGVENNLTNGVNNGYASSVIVDNQNNVYVGGYDGVNGKIWEIGGTTQTFAPLTSGNVVRIRSVFKLGSDLFACGYEMNSNGTNPNYRVWRNSSLLFSSSGSTNTVANSIFVVPSPKLTLGFTAYVTGRIGNRAVVWKNGSPIYLSNGAYSASAESVYVVGHDVFVAGYEYTGSGRLAKLWKNGVATNLTTDVTGDALASSVFVKNSHVFAGGTVRNPIYSNVANVATVWRGRNTTSLSTQNYSNHIYSIYAK